MAQVPPSAEALLDLQKKLRELAAALRDKGIVVADDAPLVDFIQAVRAADTVPDVIELFKENPFSEWKNRTLPAMRLSTTYNPRPTARYLFFNNINLERVPAIQGLELAVDAQGMFNGCSSLREITLPTLPAVEDLSRLAQQCDKLETLTIGEVPEATNIYCLCYQSPALRQVTLTTSSKITNASYAFNGCARLEEIQGVVDLSGATAIAECFGGCSSLREVRIRGLKDSLQLHASPKLSKDSLRYLVDNLTPSSGKSLTLSRALFTADRPWMEQLARDAALKGFAITYR